jgi:hypothetical protein
VTTPLEPIRGVRIEPPTPARRVERLQRDQQRGGGGSQWESPPEQNDEPETDEDTGLHIDVLA